MTATATEKTLFRYEFDGDETTMPDAWIDALFTDAAAEYTGYNRRVIVAAANLKAAIQIRNRAAKKVDYEQNATTEKLGQLAAHWEKVIKTYQVQLDDAIAATSGSSVRIARGTVKPTRRREFPDS